MSSKQKVEIENAWTNRPYGSQITHGKELAISRFDFVAHQASGVTTQLIFFFALFAVQSTALFEHQRDSFCDTSKRFLARFSCGEVQVRHPAHGCADF